MADAGTATAPNLAKGLGRETIGDKSRRAARQNDVSSLRERLAVGREIKRPVSYAPPRPAFDYGGYNDIEVPLRPIPRRPWEQPIHRPLYDGVDYPDYERVNHQRARRDDSYIIDEEIRPFNEPVIEIDRGRVRTVYPSRPNLRRASSDPMMGARRRDSSFERPRPSRYAEEYVYRPPAPYYHIQYPQYPRPMYPPAIMPGMHDEDDSYQSFMNLGILDPVAGEFSDPLPVLLDPERREAERRDQERRAPIYSGYASPPPPPAPPLRRSPSPISVRRGSSYPVRPRSPDDYEMERKMKEIENLKREIIRIKREKENSNRLRASAGLIIRERDKPADMYRGRRGDASPEISLRVRERERARNMSSRSRSRESDIGVRRAVPDRERQRDRGPIMMRREAATTEPIHMFSATRLPIDVENVVWAGRVRLNWISQRMVRKLGLETSTSSVHVEFWNAVKFAREFGKRWPLLRVPKRLTRVFVSWRFKDASLEPNEDFFHVAPFETVDVIFGWKSLLKRLDTEPDLIPTQVIVESIEASAEQMQDFPYVFDDILATNRYDEPDVLEDLKTDRRKRGKRPLRGGGRSNSSSSDSSWDSLSSNSRTVTNLSRRFSVKSPKDSLGSTPPDSPYRSPALSSPVVPVSSDSFRKATIVPASQALQVYVRPLTYESFAQNLPDTTPPDDHAVVTSHHSASTQPSGSPPPALSPEPESESEKSTSGPPDAVGDVASVHSSKEGSAKTRSSSKSASSKLSISPSSTPSSSGRRMRYYRRRAWYHGRRARYYSRKHSAAEDAEDAKSVVSHSSTSSSNTISGYEASVEAAPRGPFLKSESEDRDSAVTGSTSTNSSEESISHGTHDASAEDEDGQLTPGIASDSKRDIAMELETFQRNARVIADTRKRTGLELGMRQWDGKVHKFLNRQSYRYPLSHGSSSSSLSRDAGPQSFRKPVIAVRDGTSYKTNLVISEHKIKNLITLEEATDAGTKKLIYEHPMSDSEGISKSKRQRQRQRRPNVRRRSRR